MKFHVAGWTIAAVTDATKHDAWEARHPSGYVCEAYTPASLRQLCEETPTHRPPNRAAVWQYRLPETRAA